MHILFDPVNSSPEKRQSRFTPLRNLNENQTLKSLVKDSEYLMWLELINSELLTTFRVLSCSVRQSTVV